jgi:hypothetical protein
MFLTIPCCAAFAYFCTARQEWPGRECCITKKLKKFMEKSPHSKWQGTDTIYRGCRNCRMLWSPSNFPFLKVGLKKNTIFICEIGKITIFLGHFLRIREKRRETILLKFEPLCGPFRFEFFKNLNIHS